MSDIRFRIRTFKCLICRFDLYDIFHKNGCMEMVVLSERCDEYDLFGDRITTVYRFLLGKVDSYIKT